MPREGTVRALRSSTSGSSVSLEWDGIGQVSSYVLEAGSSPGAADVAVLNVSSLPSHFAATAQSGLYYVRMRGKNACAVSAPSNEVMVGTAAPRCQAVVSPFTQYIFTEARNYSASVSAAAGCAWTVFTSEAHAMILTTSGTGAGVFQYFVRPGLDGDVEQVWVTTVTGRYQHNIFGQN